MTKKYYKFYYHEGETFKEVSKYSETDLTLGDLRGMFYDWCACLGYPVQKEWTYMGETDTKNVQDMLGTLKDVE